jgi:putative transposase
MPFKERTVQRYGVEIDKTFYYHDVLRRWIDAPDPNKPKLKRLFKFKRFYPHLSSIYFFDPDLKDYFEISTRDSTFPDMSIWDLKEIRRAAKAEGKPDSQIDEEYIKQRYYRMREHEEQAAEKNQSRPREGRSAPNVGGISKATSAPAGFTFSTRMKNIEL